MITDPSLPLRNTRKVTWILFTVLAIVTAVALFFTHAKQPLPAKKTVAVISASPTPIALPSLSPSASPITTFTPSPSPSVTPNASADPVPSTVSQMFVTFFAAFKAQNALSLHTMFVVDTDADLKSLGSRLFTGMDLNGVPGGPTLFQTNSAGERATEYEILSVNQVGSAWHAMFREQRVSIAGAVVAPALTQMTLVPSSTSGTWLISQYAYQTTTGKYDAFIVQ